MEAINLTASIFFSFIISRRVSSLSSGEGIFNKNADFYNMALNRAEYKLRLKYYAPNLDYSCMNIYVTSSDKKFEDPRKNRNKDRNKNQSAINNEIQNTTANLLLRLSDNADKDNRSKNKCR